MKRCVLIDRDGTLARIDRTLVDPDLSGHDRGDWQSFNAAIAFDSPVPAVVALTRSIAADIDVIVLTGRSDEFRWPMTNWLHKHNVRYDRLLMRPSKDQRADEKVKRDLYETLIRPFYEVLFAVDDRPQVCEMWRSIGVPLIQVSQPEDLPPFQNLALQDDQCS